LVAFVTHSPVTNKMAPVRRSSELLFAIAIDQISGTPFRYSSSVRHLKESFSAPLLRCSSSHPASIVRHQSQFFFFPHSRVIRIDQLPIFSKHLLNHPPHTNIHSPQPPKTRKCAPPANPNQPPPMETAVSMAMAPMALPMAMDTRASLLSKPSQILTNID